MCFIRVKNERKKKFYSFNHISSQLNKHRHKPWKWLWLMYNNTKHTILFVSFLWIVEHRKHCSCYWIFCFSSITKISMTDTNFTLQQPRNLEELACLVENTMMQIEGRVRITSDTIMCRSRNMIEFRWLYLKLWFLFQLMIWVNKLTDSNVILRLFLRRKLLNNNNEFLLQCDLYDIILYLLKQFGFLLK